MRGEEQQWQALGVEPGSVHDIRTLRLKLRSACVGTGQVARLLEASAFPLTERGFTMLIVSCRKSGQWRMAVEIFNTMTGWEFSQRGVKPNFYTFSSLVSVCSAAGACSQAMRVFKDMRKQAVRNVALIPDAGLYSKIVKACHRRGRHKDVVYLYNSMAQDEVKGVSSDTLVRMLESLGLMCKWEQMCELVETLERDGRGVSIDAYTRMLYACAARGAFDVAVQLFLGMQVAGVCPDSVACHHMACVAVRCAGLEVCLDLLDSMVDANIQIGEATLDTILKAMLNSGLRDQARDLLTSFGEETYRSVHNKWGAALLETCNCGHN